MLHRRQIPHLDCSLRDLQILFEAVFAHWSLALSDYSFEAPTLRNLVIPFLPRALHF